MEHPEQWAWGKLETDAICRLGGHGSVVARLAQTPMLSRERWDEIIAAHNACLGLTTAQLQALPAGALAKVVEFAKSVRDMTDFENPDSLASDDPHGCLETIAAKVRILLAPFTQEPADAQR